VRAYDFSDQFTGERKTRTERGYEYALKYAQVDPVKLRGLLLFTAITICLDGFRCERLPANLLQAQRDYYGAHTCERTDQPRGKFFHTNWTGRGGNTSAGTYTV
jgi:6-phosphogluconate dehydrogenase